jgi:segregation and condensation protein B
MDDEVEISLEDLGRTYQQLLSGSSDTIASAQPQTTPTSAPEWSSDDEADHQINTSAESILEALLFVGHPKNRPMPAAGLAAMMRGVAAEQIPELVATINDGYQIARQSLRIDESDEGYRMVLLGELNEIKSVFAGRIQAVKLNQQAIDCLSIIAYTPGITIEDIDKRWGRSAAGVVRMLIRRNLVELKLEGSGRSAIRRYFTTERFLDLVGLESLADLPVAWEIA